MEPGFQIQAICFPESVKILTTASSAGLEIKVTLSWAYLPVIWEKSVSNLTEKFPNTAIFVPATQVDDRITKGKTNVHFPGKARLRRSC